MSPFDRISEFVLSNASGVTLEQRVSLYRDLSTLTTDEDRARELAELANSLEAIDRRHAQLLLDFARPDARKARVISL